MGMRAGPRDGVTATLTNIARRSGGLTLEEVHANGAEVVAFVKAMTTGTKIYLELQASNEQPEKIRAYQVVPLPHPTSEMLRPLPDGATSSEQLEAARMALQRAAERDLFSGVLIVASHGKAKGMLSYDAPIAHYLSDYPDREVALRITLRQLLTHTSGLADIYAEAKPKTPLRRLTDYYPLFANRPLLATVLGRDGDSGSL